MKSKQQLREEMRERLSYGEGSKEMGDQAISFVAASMAFKDAHCVMLYMPMAHEPDTHPLLEETFALNKRLVLPRCYKDALLKAHEVRRGDVLSRSFYGIMEPSKTAPIVSVKDIDYILIPALAYDINGYRLGRGAGYFDRYLADSNACKVGICYSFQIVDKLPIEKHDVRVDMLFTEAGGFITGGQL